MVKQEELLKLLFMAFKIVGATCRIEKLITLSSIIFELLKGSKITLYSLAINSISKTIKHKSKEQKIRRLLTNFPICALTYAKFIMWLFQKNNEVELIVDRTNWEFGTKSINYLVLSVIFSGISFPIYWLMLDNNGGSSHFDKRIQLIEWFVTNFKHIKIKNLFADREFPSASFISWLTTNGINFIMRVKGNIKVESGFKQLSLSKLYSYMLKQNYALIRKRMRKMFGQNLFLSIVKGERGELIYIISNQYHENPFEEYSKRWKIEVMFGNYKIKGFNLESTHITDLNRLSSIFMILSISYAYCCKMGIIRDYLCPIKIKSKLDKLKKIKVPSKEFSRFKYGNYMIHDFLKNIITNSKTLFNSFLKWIIRDNWQIDAGPHKLLDLIKVF